MTAAARTTARVAVARTAATQRQQHWRWHQERGHCGSNGSGKADSEGGGNGNGVGGGNVGGKSEGNVSGDGCAKGGSWG